MERLIILFLSFVHALSMLAGGTDEVRKVKYPGGKTYMYRVTLKDKAGTGFSLDKPSGFLSEKAIARRRRQHVEVDSTDLPVSKAYIDAISSAGVDVVSHSKWNNTVLVRTRKKDRMQAVAALGCVAAVKKVWTSPDSITPVSARSRYHTEFNRWDTVAQNKYGVAEEQIKSLNGWRLHDKGFTGRGITIAVLDGGFMNVDMIPCFRGVDIVGWGDFVVPKSQSIFKEMEHGTKVLSVMALDEPETFVGTAPGASYWLLRCEDNQTESLAEEDYWAAAAEFADSVGVDIISSSLGFHAFDEPSDNYRYGQLDGLSSLISHTASMLSGKGMILVNSAGNDGMGTWKKINVPADARDALAIGAISPNGRNAAFSSVGPTADGRVKPDVMAQGSPASVITGRGTIIKDMGTSFSAPLVSGMVACLWQALPDKTAKEIMELVRRSGDNAASPDNVYGYGVPDFWKAYQLGKRDNGIKN